MDSKVYSLIVWWIQTSDKVFYNLLMSFHMQKKRLGLQPGGEGGLLTT